MAGNWINGWLHLRHIVHGKAVHGGSHLYFSSFRRV